MTCENAFQIQIIIIILQVPLVIKISTTYSINDKICIELYDTILEYLNNTSFDEVNTNSLVLLVIEAESAEREASVVVPESLVIEGVPQSCSERRRS